MRPQQIDQGKERRRGIEYKLANQLCVIKGAQNKPTTGRAGDPEIPSLADQGNSKKTLDLLFFIKQVIERILGKMVNFQNVNLLKSQLAKNINQSLLEILSMGCLFWQVDFFGELTFLRLTISPTIYCLCYTSSYRIETG